MPMSQSAAHPQNYFDEKTSDEELARLCLELPELYGILVNRYDKILRSFVARNFIKDPDLVEDIIQETFIKAYLHLRRFDLAQKWKSWIYKIAVNTAFSMLRGYHTEDLHEYLD